MMNLHSARRLLGNAISGAAPADIEKVARTLGNQIADDIGGVPPAKDRELNQFDYTQNEGRWGGGVGLRFGDHLDHPGQARSPDRLSPPKRLSTGPVRKAIILRDTRCISLIPPVEVDPQRRPLPAYNRRTNDPRRLKPHSIVIGCSTVDHVP